MLKELTENGNNIKEEMRVILSEIKKNLQGTFSGEEEARIQINNLEHKKGISIQLEQQEEKKKFKKKISKSANIQIIGVPEGDRRSKKLKTYLKK